MRRIRQGQSTVEYMLAISVISIALAAGFLYLTDSVKWPFQSASQVVNQPYP